MNSTHAQRIAANVRAELARKQVTQADIAERLHFSRAAIGRRTSGHVDFKITELYVIAEMLDVPVSALLGEAVAA